MRYKKHEKLTTLSSKNHLDIYIERNIMDEMISTEGNSLPYNFQDLAQESMADLYGRVQQVFGITNQELDLVNFVTLINRVKDGFSGSSIYVLNEDDPLKEKRALIVADAEKMAMLYPPKISIPLIPYMIDNQTNTWDIPRVANGSEGENRVEFIRQPLTWQDPENNESTYDLFFSGTSWPKPIVGPGGINPFGWKSAVCMRVLRDQLLLSHYSAADEDTLIPDWAIISSV